MKKKDMKKLTVGDMSGTSRYGESCTVVRNSLAEIAEGEVVKIRFKDEFHMTEYRYYRLDKKYFRDEYDTERGRYTGVFSRVHLPGEGAERRDR